jgi:hypothetical protein
VAPQVEQIRSSNLKRSERHQGEQSFHDRSTVTLRRSNIKHI